MNRIAIITARGGSKRIPRKNIRHFCGRPALSYAIRAARESGLFTEVMVSTEDEEIKAVAEAEGASVPFLRSAETANDHATTAQVLTEVLQEYAARGMTFEEACCLYPTAVFVTAAQLQEAAALLEKENADTVMPVTAFDFPPQRGMRFENGRLSYAFPEYRDARSQDLPQMVHDIGQFYFFRTAPFLKSGLLIGENTAGIPVPAMQAQDIDTEEDWEMAEYKYRYLHREENL